MNTIEILVLCEMLAILIVGYILKKQNDSQKAIIENLEKYSSIIDVDKLTKYDKFREEAVMLKASSLVLDGLKPEIKLASEAAIKKATELLNVKYREFINFGLEVINNSSPESKQKILDFYFTENREFIETALASHNKSKNE